jgi:hypothetical protein
VLGLATIAAGVWITWLGLTRTLDKTTFAADDEALVISTGPVPMHRPKRLPLSQIRSFSLGRRGQRASGPRSGVSGLLPSGSTQHDLEDAPPASGRWIETWKVVAHLRDDSEVVIARGIQERRNAVAIRRLLQEHVERTMRPST